MKRKKLAAAMMAALTMISMTGCASNETTEESTAESTAALTAGTFTATGTGLHGEFEISVTVSEDAIESINIVEENETAGVGDKALQLIADEIVKKQTVNVDNVSGATVSSAAMIATVKSALGQAGDISRFQIDIEDEYVEETYDYDVVVVGSGIAGLTAALEAASEGASTALIEKLGIVGGTSVFSSGAFLATAEKEAVEQTAQVWTSRNTIQEKNVVDQEMVNAAMAVSPQAVELIASTGIEYSMIYDMFFYPSSSEKAQKNATTVTLADADTMIKSGENLIAYMTSKAEEMGVDVYLNTPATSLLQMEDGTVTGVVSDTEDALRTFNAGAVILATGDYARNAEMTAEICPDAAGDYTATSVGNTGDGITMALEAGGVLYDFQESLSGIFAPDPYDMPIVGQPNNSYPYDCVLVNSNGERLASETIGTHEQMYYFLNEDGTDSAWVIMDQQIADRFLNLEEYLEKTTDSSYIQAYQADSIEELAELIGADQETLCETISHYNELCEAGEDSDFGKESEYLNAIDDGTYYAVKEYNMTRGNYGGIQTNTNAEVIDKDGNAIPGLYAAGIVSSGAFFGDYYPGGEALSVGVHMGYIAGRNASQN